MAERLDHLVMKVTPIGWANYQLRQVVAKAMHHIPGSRKALRFFKSVITHIENVDRSYQLTRKFSQRASGKNTTAQSFDSGYGYESEMFELSVAEHYRDQIEKGNWDKQRTESHDLYRTVIPLLQQTMEKNGIKKMLDFGVGYAYVNDQLAQRMPNVEFSCVDRSVLTKVYNEKYFNLPNLHFIAGDIYDSMNGEDWREGLCFHMRTMTCMPESFIREFYAKCHERGFKYIVGAEQCGLSWQLGEPYTFSLEPKPSVAFRNFMFIHNYPGLLREAGYELVTSELLKTRHPDPNYRLLVFSARRVEKA